MRHAFASNGDAIAQRLILGFVNVCSAHPLVTFCFLALMVVLAGQVWLDQTSARSSNRRWSQPSEADRPIQMRR